MQVKSNFIFANLYQCAKGFKTDARIMDYHYILYVHKGNGIFEIGNNKYHAEMGDIFYCPPFIKNVIMADVETPFLLTGLEFTINEGRILNINPHMNVIKSSYLISCINEMVSESRNKEVNYEEVCSNITNALINILERLSRKGVCNNNIGDEILNYLVNNFERKITHKELSEIFSYHKNSINRILKLKTGKSLINYQIELRIKKAMEFLKYSTKTIGEISEICGYSRDVFFAKQFKEKVGVSPSAFRKN